MSTKARSATNSTIAPLFSSAAPRKFGASCTTAQAQPDTRCDQSLRQAEQSRMGQAQARWPAIGGGGLCAICSCTSPLTLSMPSG
jgi:hypothetical protein